METEAFEAAVAELVQAWTASVDASVERVVAIQALWDADHSGAEVVVELVVALGAGLAARPLARVGDVELVKRAGAEVAHARGLDFSLRSPEELEDLERRLRALVEDQAGRHGNVFFLIVHGDGDLRSRMGLLLGDAHAGLVAELTRVLAARASYDAHIETVLSAAEVAEVAAWCARSVDEQLAEYQPRAELPEWLTQARPLVWRDREHVVQSAFNDVGAAIWKLLAFHTFFAGCVAPATMHVFGNGGVTERDAAFLGLAAAHGAGATTTELRAAFPFLTEDAIEATLAKLAARGFVTRSGERYDLLLKGYGVSIAGPA